MLLNDIGKSLDSTLKKINQHLESNYGFRIAENASDRDLVAIMEQIEVEITDLKIKGNDARDSSEISKRLLILEGIKTLREFAVLQFQSPDLENVVGNLCNFVCDDFKLSGMHHADFEDSVRAAMKQYRSSKYRFPDDIIEQRVRSGAMQKIRNGPSEVGTEELTPGINAMFEDEDEDMKDTKSVREDSSNWGHVGKHGSAVPTNKQSAAAAKKLGPDKEPELVPKTPPPGVKAGHNWMDPPRRRAKESVVKEKYNLVKNLRRLLETEVQQAEVMMGAKKFSEKLQEMIETIGRLQNEDLPPVVDQMRITYGTESSSAFQTQIYGAFQGVMDALYTAKGQVDDAVSNLATTGQIGVSNDMDMDVANMVEPGIEDPAMADPGIAAPGDEMGADLDNLEGDMDVGDEFGGAEEEEPLGRAMKEAYLKRQVVGMRKLVEKARALREAQEEQELDEVINTRDAAGNTAANQGERDQFARYAKQTRKYRRDNESDPTGQRQVKGVRAGSGFGTTSTHDTNKERAGKGIR